MSIYDSVVILRAETGRSGWSVEQVSRLLDSVRLEAAAGIRRRRKLTKLQIGEEPARVLVTWGGGATDIMWCVVASADFAPLLTCLLLAFIYLLLFALPWFCFPRQT